MSKMIVSPEGSERPSKHAHKLVHSTAVGMAHEIYDELMRRNDWYENWKTQNPGLSGKGLEDRFVARVAPTLLKEARAALAAMLATPIDEALKQTIMEALILDASLMRGRA